MLYDISQSGALNIFTIYCGISILQYRFIFIVHSAYALPSRLSNPTSVLRLSAGFLSIKTLYIISQASVRNNIILSDEQNGFMIEIKAKLKKCTTKEELERSWRRLTWSWMKTYSRRYPVSMFLTKWRRHRPARRTFVIAPAVPTEKNILSCPLILEEEFLAMKCKACTALIYYDSCPRILSRSFIHPR